MNLTEWHLKIRDGVSANLAKITATADKTSSQFTQLQSQLSQVESKIGRANSQASNFTGTLKGIAATAGVAFGIGAIASYSTKLVDTAIQAEGYANALALVEGNAEKARASQKWIDGIADKYGRLAYPLTEGFIKVSAAAKGTVVHGQGVKDIIEGITMASASLNLSQDESQGAILALSQMLSKGKVSAEELTGQLGERIPGALGIAARAMGMTQSELLKLVQSGNLASEKFIPKFAKQLIEEFAAPADKASHSLLAAKNRMENAFNKLIIIIAEKVIPFFQKLFNKVKEVVGWISSHSGQISDVFESVGLGVAILASGFGALSVKAKLSAWFVGQSVLATTAHAFATEGMAAAQRQLNVALSANPIGAAITIIAALAGAIYYAWQKSEKFRGVMTGIWNVIKSVASVIWGSMQKALTVVIEKWGEFKDAMSKVWDFMKPFFQWIGKAAMVVLQPFVMLFKEIVGAFKWVLDKLGITEKITKAVNTVSNKFNEGYSQGAKPLTEAKESDSLLDVLNPKNENGTPKVPDNVSEGIGAVSSGGKSVRVVNVSIGKLVDQVHVHSTTLKEGMTDVKQLIEEYLIRAINGGEIALGNE